MDVIERMTVVIGSNVSNISVRRTVTPEKLKNGQKCCGAVSDSQQIRLNTLRNVLVSKTFNYKRFLR